jgi:hypothetical protein
MMITRSESNNFAFFPRMGLDGPGSHHAGRYNLKHQALELASYFMFDLLSFVVCFGS